jgi:anti-anti-sigma factor
MKLTLVSIEKEGLIRAATDGNITAGDFSPAGKNPLETLLGLTWANTRLLLDLSKTTYIDSSAIGWLISTSRAFRDGGGAFVIHSVQPAVRQIMDVLRIGRVVPIADDEPAARKVLNGASE